MSQNRADSIAARFAQLVETVDELRERCAWDREQTLETLARGLVEESYETLAAVEDRHTAELRGEFGDLIVQLLFGALIATERNWFTLEELLSAARAKLIRRHPHVYGDAAAKDSAQALASWERIKREERAQAGLASALDGIARTIPALIRAQKLGARAHDAGFDWRNIHQVIAKVREELEEVEAAVALGDSAAAAQELGDAMLALGNAPRMLGHDAETTLRAACGKFERRFRHLERAARERKLELTSLDDAQLDELWNEAKRALGQP
jgi:nucleoside triphosphate diphosphatase